MSFSSSVMKHLMNERNGNRAFANRGRDPLDRAAAHVSNRTDPRPARLQQIRRRLARGIPATDNHDFLTHAHLRLHVRGGVVHAGAFKLRRVCDCGLSVLCPRRDDQRPRIDAPSIFQVHGVQGMGACELRRT